MANCIIFYGHFLSVKNDAYKRILGRSLVGMI